MLMMIFLKTRADFVPYWIDLDSLLHNFSNLLNIYIEIKFKLHYISLNISKYENARPICYEKIIR